MKKNIEIRAIVIALLLGFSTFKVVSCKTQRDYVEALQRQIPDAIMFIEENRDLLEMLVDIRDRVNDFNEKNEYTEIYYYNFHPEYGDEERLEIDIYYKNITRAVKSSKDFDYFNILKPGEEERINQAREIQSIIVYQEIIEICYAESGWAELIIRNPHLYAYGGLAEEVNPDYLYSIYEIYDEKDYKNFWYYDIIDENWLIELINIPRS